jgi:hypothetical protein
MHVAQRITMHMFEKEKAMVKQQFLYDLWADPHV